MKRKHLLSHVQQIDGFNSPNILLEQYMTPPDIACDILLHADVKDKVVVDLGCGTGMLSICSLFLEAKHVYAVDIDKKALISLLENADGLLEDPLSSLTTIESDIQSVSGISGDICICNPPFGTRNQGIDKLFIKKGLELCPVMFSLHKSSTRDHLLKYCKSLHLECQVIAEIRYNIESSYSFHKDMSKNIQVDLLRIERMNQI